ncbi:hypothetical protein [Gryllotalpicola protaetiae]|uniref:Uncharacterized protein n=1 Tax=Gryllotalpicola protaetiae TaxID=2419771 RepID=A0A387BYE0_9MICO|nr:hypothetical protein [Gryllotalpicola protaetiae]AYG03361.1 hypothetical protein D7I44_07330 [Gryllotalpicola protaetiae]
MSSDTASWAENAEQVQRERNSRVQVCLFLAVLAVAIIGGCVLISGARNTGLSIPPAFARLGIGTFDGINFVALFMWAWSFQALSIHDGANYPLRLRNARVRRSKTSDVLILIVYPLAAVLWGELAVHRTFASRATDAGYAGRLPHGTPAESLQHAAVEVTIAYFVVVGLVVALILVARLFNPIDFDEYDEYLRRVLHVRRPQKPFS